jgi:hypothetical protein
LVDDATMRATDLDFSQLDSLTSEPMRIEKGHAIPSDEPGLGIAGDFKAIKRATVDGSGFTLEWYDAEREARFQNESLHAPRREGFAQS